ncbi:MAG: rod shape-determining protein [Caloramator sp.]|nr:rod shape-determining protein [Caloramator sp.]
MEGLKFAIDIGTRTVIGVAYCVEEGKTKIMDVEIEEHKKRSMFDGQVHDIAAVSEVVLKVKSKLEEKLDTKIEKVSIAAAGRTLKTCKYRLDKHFEANTFIDKDIISQIEMEALQGAYNLMEKGDSEEEFYCVGYSVVNYYLNDYIITSLEGHKANKISVEILASFLPRSVVDSLYEVISRCNMTVENLTLEPIAAMNAIIPKDLRLLNLALVDIGAGTSDIAITKDGTVVGFGMVPFAGDEITEAICHYLVVDFNTGEKIKMEMGAKKKEIKYVDVLGNKKTIKKEELQEAIRDVVGSMGRLICEKIIELNGKSPNAVFLVGGGSKVDGISEYISHQLNLPKERVVVKGLEAVKGIVNLSKKKLGPEGITPIGIALTSTSANTFVKVKVNGKEVKLYGGRKMKVSDCLAQAGLSSLKLFGRSGRSLNFKLNGEPKKIYGGNPTQGLILLNGELANIMAEVKDGDEIIVREAVDGKDAKVLIKELVKDGQAAYVNSKLVDLNYEIKDGDEVTIIDKENFIKVKVNGREIKLENKEDGYIFIDIFNYIDFDVKSVRNVKLLLNGRQASYTDRIYNGDEIEIQFT